MMFRKYRKIEGHGSVPCFSHRLFAKCSDQDNLLRHWKKCTTRINFSELLLDRVNLLHHN